jgi:outer membrane protein
VTPFLLIATAAGASLSYDDALARAIEHNPSLAQAAAELDAAEAGITSAKGVWDPQLSTGLSRGWEQELGVSQFGPYSQSTNSTSWNVNLGQTLATGTSWNANWVNNSGTTEGTIDLGDLGSQDYRFETGFSRVGLSLSQQLLKGHKMAYNLETVRSAKMANSQAEIALSQQRQDLLSATAQAYWDLVYAVEAQRTAAQAVEVAQEERRIVQAQLDAGNMAPVELTRVEAAVAQARMALIEADNALAAASDALAVQVGLPTGGAIQPASAVGEAASLDIDLEAATQAAMDGNPGLAALRLGVDNAESSLSFYRHAMLPTLSLDGSVGAVGFSDENGYSAALSQVTSLDQPTASIGGTFSVPLGLRVERGNLRSAAAGVTSAEMQLHSAENALAQQVGGLVRELETSRRRIELAELNLRLAEETLSAEKSLQEAGRAIQKDVLAAQRERDAAQVSVLQARTSYRKALVQLEAAQGKL